jgi:hypothetical protein
MIQNLIRTCDLCHGEIRIGEYRQRNAGKFSPEIMMILAENEGRDLQLIELPDGSVSLDTCFKCYTRIGFTHSQLLN